MSAAPRYVGHHVVGRIHHRAHPVTFQAVSRKATLGACTKSPPVAGQPGGLPALPAGRFATPTRFPKLGGVAGAAATGAAALFAVGAVASTFTPVSFLYHAAQPLTPPSAPAAQPVPAPLPLAAPLPQAYFPPISAPVAPPRHAGPPRPLDPGPPSAPPHATPSPLPAIPPIYIGPGPHGHTVGGRKGGGTAVPEPSSIALFAMAAFFAIAARLARRTTIRA